MKILKLFLVLSVSSLLLFACKDEKKLNENVSTEDTTHFRGIKRAPKKELTTNDKKIISSVLFKIMSDPQLKEFASAVVSSELKDLLSIESGSYTVLAPTNAAFDAIPEATLNPFLKPENKASFATLIKNHIIEGRFSSEELLQQIDKEGPLKVETLEGAKLTISKEGTNIVITDANGKKATIGNKDNFGGNGVVHSLDAVLYLK